MNWKCNQLEFKESGFIVIYFNQEHPVMYEQFDMNIRNLLKTEETEEI